MSLERSYMFVPGTDPEAIADALGSVADVVIVDLEDTVRQGAKADARESVLDLIESGSSGDVADGPRLTVRVNGLDTEHGVADVRAIAAADHPPELVFVPDVRGPTEVRIVDDILADHGADVGIVPLLEQPDAFFEARSIARSTDRVRGLLFAAIDFQMNVGMSILDETDLSVPRSVLSMAAGAAGISAIDKPNLAAVHDRDRTRSEARAAKAVGYDGKAAMSDEQAAVINDVFTPSREEVDRAKRFVDAFEAREKGVAVIDGVAIDKPVVDQLRDTLERARSAGMDV
ncbi:HpcH/HpaI aldolase/citrate lyase family protein [Halopenitus salinus]|uniref:HpcH/HpaI aldolase/citrate lyase family protein n=1 Tax=Halopenitus salinus TaxID=1198295 RepID=A0ABD5UWT4_9EURY